MARKSPDQRPTAIVVGALFIAATVFSILAGVVNAPVLAASDIALAAAENAGLMGVSTVLMLLACASIVAIPIVLYPIFRRFSEVGAVAYVVIRVIEAGFFLVGALFVMGLIALGQAEQVNPGVDPGVFAVIAALQVGLYDAAFDFGPMIAFSIGAMVFAALLYRSFLVPRWLSIWAFLGGVLLLVEGLLIIFGLSTELTSATLFLPIAINEMVLAVWLIVKGFDRDAIAHLIG